MDSKHSMTEHLRTMFALIRDLKASGNNLTNEQQVTAVIHSLPEPTCGKIIQSMIVKENLEFRSTMSLGLIFELHGINNVLHCQKCVGSNGAAQICDSKCV